MDEQAISRVLMQSQAQARFINTFALVVLPGVAALGILLAYILSKQILEPIRRLALETGPGGRQKPGLDEVKALSRGVHSLIENVDQAQSELERSQEHLLQTGKWAMVGKLAAGVAHSIRNPLTSVNMRLFSLKRSLKMTSSQREDFEVISEEIRRLDAIVRNFLEFSRPPKLKMQNIGPSDVVDGALQLLRHRLESYGVEVKLLRSGRLPEILGDPDQLKEVLANLLVNACEVMVHGGVITIEEEARLSVPPGPAVVIRVSDTGPGIAESIRPQVFQPFFSTKEEGTGLGLSIATRIIEDHGGRLELAAAAGEGATFIITLPLGETDSMGKILIVDDDPQLRQSFEKVLIEDGHQVKTASSGEAALALVKAETPDLVIMDVRLPGMDGLETFRAIHEMEPKLPVIVMTAYGTTETAIEATKLGAFEYVLKPPEFPDMLALIAQALEAGRFMRSRVELDVAPTNAAAEAIIGRSKPMQEVYKAIGRVAPTDATVLIRGESGTGKELVARAIYQHSLRAAKPFLVINCVAIPETLLESELFGYEKGAFTGAVQPPGGQVRAGPRGHRLSGRNRRHALQHPGQDTQTVAGEEHRTPGRPGALSRWTCASSRPPTGTWKPPWPQASSGKTSITASRW